ncbi:MAG TPA: efflux RND transporter periplasmic adaptor subunit [candidate division Zixibacteria bacterium]|nr:efflux RND transporter periplasmic adaptor subunit [candidate division Zixibacteria bacterium]
MSIRKTSNWCLLWAAAAAAAGCGDSPGDDAGRSGGNPGGAAMPVNVIVVQPQPLDNKIFTTGTLLANEEVALRPEISGRVVGLYIEEGKAVKKGDLLVKLNDRELEAQLRRKQHEEALAAEEERRANALLDIKGISQEDYDRTLNKLRMIQAEREVIEAQLAETEILAPFDGTVGLRYISAGGVVTPSTLVATMQDTDPVKVEFSIPEKHAGKLAVKTPVLVQVGDAPERHEGTVYAVEAKVDPATRTLKARATVPNPDGRLIPGSFAKVEITLEHLPDALIVPAQAIVPQLGGDLVYVCREGAARATPVTVGLRGERTAQIIQGLAPGDTVITTGLLQLNDGKKVAARPEPADRSRTGL